MKRHLWAALKGKTMRCLRRGCKALRRPGADKYEYKDGLKGADWSGTRPTCTGQPTTNT